VKLVRRRFFLPVYRCPTCGATNLFFEDRHYRRFSDVGEALRRKSGL
jgi:hypothetical protein